MPYVYRVTVLLTLCTASKFNYTFDYDHVSEHLVLAFYNKSRLVSILTMAHSIGSDIPISVDWENSCVRM
jgi:hypothetical protein